jgi:hypothetical protein
MVSNVVSAYWKNCCVEGGAMPSVKEDRRMPKFMNDADDADADEEEEEEDDIGASVGCVESVIDCDCKRTDVPHRNRMDEDGNE